MRELNRSKAGHDQQGMQFVISFVISFSSLVVGVIPCGYTISILAKSSILEGKILV